MIIGITGTLGAGKGTVVEYLVRNKGFNHFSAREFITEEIKKRGLEVNRDSMVLVGNDLRAQNSPAYVVEELYRRALATGGDSVIESVRTVGEIEALRNKENFYLLAVDADIKTRFDRIRLRASNTDQVSFEKFVEQEEKELHSDDFNKQNLAECIKRADFVLNNDGSVKDLYAQIEEIFKSLNH